MKAYKLLNSLKDRVADWKRRFRILDDWIIEVGPDGDYMDEVIICPNENKAHIRCDEMWPEEGHHPQCPVRMCIEQLVESLNGLVSYTVACEGLLNASEAGQVRMARQTLQQWNMLITRD